MITVSLQDAFFESSGGKVTRYWLEKLSCDAKCPNDHHQLRQINYQRSGQAASLALECPFCNSIFLQYTNAEDAAKQTDISINCLSIQERGKIQKLRVKTSPFSTHYPVNKEPRISAARARELRKNWEERQQRLKAEKEAQRIAAEKEKEAQRIAAEREKARLAALREQRENLIAQINWAFVTDYLSAESVYLANNRERLLTKDEYVGLREKYVSDWFAKHPVKTQITPDENQTIAIGATSKNIEVVARAGSGKTATIVNRFRFLTENCHVDASSILLLAFNRKAAEELRGKIEKLISNHPEKAIGMPYVMTFHALAYSIVHPLEKLIYDDEEAGSQELSRAVQAIIDKRIKDVTWASKIKSVMLDHFKGNWEDIEAAGHNLSKEDRLVYLRSLPNQTLKGDYVKSFGEKVIADLLFENDVEYKYEKARYWTDGTIYRPDFTIATADNRQVIIEYFGLVGNSEYDLQIQRKESYCRGKDIPLIEVYPADVTGDLTSFTTELLKHLKEEKVSYRRLSEDEIWERIKDRAIDEFTGAVKSFIGRCRKKDLSPAELEDLIQNYTSDLQTENTFLEIVSSIYAEYIRKLQDEHLEDFDGLMSRAVACVREGKTEFGKWDQRGDLKGLAFIMIDEYQDFSYLFDAFLKEIRSVCPKASIFCVGDDWQAINAFAGSDVQFFQQFTQRYKDSNRYYLRSNYRSKKEIVALGAKLMSRGESKETIQAVRSGYGTVRIGYLNEFSNTPVEQSIHEDDFFTPAILRLVASILGLNKRVVFLTRTNDRFPAYFTPRVDTKGSRQEKFLASIQSFFTPDLRMRITASTTHKYKGKEEDVVIILDAMAGFYPLIHPTWVFQRVFGDTIEKLIEEERRLFYVAVSRAKDDLFILTTKDKESPFLSALGSLIKLNWNDYAPLKTDEASIKVEVCNQKGYGSSPTHSIRELLKADQYAWDAQKKVWYRFFPQEGFDIEEILDQAWVKKASHILLIQYDEDNKPKDAFLIEHGSIKQLKS